jgi:transposase
MRRVVMEAIYQCVGGLDVHQKVIAGCRRRLIGEGKVESEVEKFGTSTRELKRLGRWLSEWGVRQVAMESTGVLWQPVWNVLCEEFELVLVNAQHLKKVPGRKTDVTDAEWIAQCMQCGLLRGSFVPNEQIRQWRDLTRQRTKLLDQRTSIVNRIHKTLEGCNIKLSTVATDVMGVSGRAMLKALSEGEQDAEKLADLARGRLKSKYDELVESLEGCMGEHHQWLLKRMLKQVEFLDEEIAAYDRRIEEMMRPFELALERLDTIDGVGRRTAEVILAEIGSEMSQFADDEAISCWAGMCPGNNESAGKRKSGRTSKGNRWLRRALVEAAYAASRKKDRYLAAQFARLARGGKKRAAVAVGHTILVAAYHILKEEADYKDLGGDYFHKRNQEKTTRRLIKQLEQFGYQVELKRVA